MTDELFEVKETEEYKKWYHGLRDQNAKSIIEVRLIRLSLGNFGKSNSVGEGVRELKIDYGPGYRIYFIQYGGKTYVLLGGGTKKRQDKDIQAAIALARKLKKL